MDEDQQLSEEQEQETPQYAYQPETPITDETAQEVPEQTDQQMDWEKAYKNLEKEFTRKSQKLSSLSKWEQFERMTGVSADTALQYLQQTQATQPQPSAAPQPQQPYTAAPYTAPTYTSNYDPTLMQIQEEIHQLRREQEAAKLTAQYPLLREHLGDVMALADDEQLDLETAFGKFLVQHFDDVAGQVAQQTVNRMTQRQRKAVEPANAPAPSSAATELTAAERLAAEAMGLTPEEYAKYK